MPSPTVLYVVATIVIALLFAWVGLVSKSRAVAWEATPEERERFAKLRPFAEGDFAGTPEADEAPAAPAKAKRKKARAKAEEGGAKAEADEAPKADPEADEAGAPEPEADAPRGEADAPKADVEETDGSSESDEKSDKAETTA
ncbi:MAG TPA: hypothetical protein PLR99_21705 [Polyangiaceae bacterium]|nr:hypothetical protein [Polyangiaceae bacterium]